MKRILPLLLLIAACTKNSDKSPTEDFPSQALVLEKGALQGTAVTASIGAGGGELSTADGAVKINVPAGAVKQATTFSIQPVTDVLQIEEPGKINYRLMPENVTFDKPVSVTMKYTAEDVADGTEDLLMIAHQDALGKWQESSTALDKANKTLTAEVTHFSDFTFYKKFKIIATKLAVSGGESTILQCGILPTASADVAPQPVGDDDLLFYLPATVEKIRVEMGDGKYAYYNHLRNSDVERVGAWSIESGGGKVVPGSSPYKLPSRAVYTAKGEIADAEQAVIKLELEGVRVKDYKAPGLVRKINKLTIRKTIRLLPSSYMRVQMDGKDTIIVNDPNPLMGEKLGAQINQGVIAIQGSSYTEDIQVMINVKTASPSATSYPCGNMTKDNMAEVLVSGTDQFARNYKGSYTSCTGDVVYSSGTVNIDKLGAKGEFIEGSFEGPVYYQDQGCTHHTKSVKIRFRIKRAL